MSGPALDTVRAALVAWVQGVIAAAGLSPEPPTKVTNETFAWGTDRPDDDPAGVARDTGYVEIHVEFGRDFAQEIGAGLTGGRYDQVGVLFVTALQRAGTGTDKAELWRLTVENAMRAGRNTHAIGGFSVRFTHYDKSSDDPPKQRFQAELAAAFEYTFTQP